MKKRNLNSLKLNKKVISSLKEEHQDQIKGGGFSEDACSTLFLTQWDCDLINSLLRNCIGDN